MHALLEAGGLLKARVNKFQPFKFAAYRALLNLNSNLLKGNEAFKKGDFATAENLYSSAIKADPSNHVCYLNRSMANLKLQR
jgi:hypothetical protein